MANARHEARNANWLAGALNLTPQSACPIPSGGVGLWVNSTYDLLRRSSDGSDSPVANVKNVAIIQVDAVSETNLQIGGVDFVYDNGTSGYGATLTGGANGAFPTVDDVTAALNKIYLFTGLTISPSGSKNGAYILSTAGGASAKAVLTRIQAFDVSADMKDGTLFVVKGGTSNADTTWKYTGGDSPTVGTTALTFERDPGVVTTNTAQTITGAKTFAVSTLKAANAGGTYSSILASSAASSDKTVTFPNATGEVDIIDLAQTLTGKTLTNVAGDQTFAKESAHIVKVAASTTGTTAGGALSVLSGNGNGAAGGDVSLDTGTGTVGGVASLGATNAESVEIGKTGKTVSVNGPMTCDEQVDLNGDVNLGNAATDTITPVGVVDGDLTFIKEVARTIKIADSTTGTTAGAKLTIKSGVGNGAAGGALEIDTGSGTAGGAITIGPNAAASVAIGSASVPIGAPGGVTMTTNKKLLAGSNEIVGTVTDKINPIHIAHAAQAVGDILYADSATTMTRLADSDAGKFLRAGGAGVAPAYSTLILPNAAAVGTIPHAASADTLTQLAPGAAGEVLTSAGAGSSLVWSSPLGTIGKKTLTIAGGVRAKLQPSVDLGTTGINTVLQNSVTGTGGNSITLTTVADGVAKAGSIVVVGNAITVHYQDGVTQVSDFEALFPAICTDGTVSVKTTGTAITVLAAPGDTFGPSNFINGAASATLTAAAVSAAINLDTALPANARLLGASIGEGSFTGFNNSGGGCTATISIEGTGGTADISAAVNVAAGQTGFPKIGAAGAQGYPMALHSSEQLTATFSSNVNLNTIDTGSVVVNVLYAVKS